MKGMMPAMRHTYWKKGLGKVGLEADDHENGSAFF
jgi:hypothetical protein